MPNVRFLNWNIRNLSQAKIAIPGMCTAIARTIWNLNPDVVGLFEVRSIGAQATMQQIATALNVLAGGAQYNTWHLSAVTSTEYYGFIVRDTTVVRPMTCAANPNAPAPPGFGTAAAPITNLDGAVWNTWPDNLWAGAAAAGQGPTVPLVNTFFSPAHDRAAKRSRANFAGRNVDDGGYSLGRGFRMPCLAMYHVHTGAGDYYFPIVCCHYAAVRSGRNHLGQSQVAQLRMLHIAQLFSWIDAQNPAPAERGYMDVNGNAESVQELIFTGDFNIDFLQNLAGGTNLERTNHDALSALTPTQQQGGSVAPPAAPGALPGGGVPMVPFPLPWSAAPAVDTISPQQLRAAVTRQATIFKRYPLPPKPPPPPPANPAATRTAAFDNFFYGGTRSATAGAAFGPAPPPGNLDSGDVIDMTARIGQPGGVLAANQIEVSGPAAFYGGAHAANLAPNLQGVAGVAPPLTLTDQWIGANLVSDHVPVVLEILCP